jgi:uncharacterized protein (DUF302 family)
MKTIILFIFGLLTWLLLTNFQVVYSKVASLTNPTEESVDEIAIHEASNQEIELSSKTEKIEKIITKNDASEENIVSENTVEKISEHKINLAQNESEAVDSELTQEALDQEALDKSVEDIATKNETETIKTTLENNTKIVTETIAETNPETNPETNSDSHSEDDIENTKQEQALQTKEALDVKSDEATTQAMEVADSPTPSIPPTNFNPGMQQPHQANMGMSPYNMMNPMMMNPGMFMNPMAMMTPMMMSMMGMMNPAMMMNPNAMLNYPINTMTQPQNLNTMMMTMDPNMLFSMFGQPSKEYLEGEVPDQLPVVKIPGMPTQTFDNWPKNKVSPGVSREAKKNAFQTAMATSPLSMRDMMGIMAEKMPVNEDVSWDDAIEAMKLRANEVNFKFVGSSKLWKEIEAVTGQPSAKVEMFRFCDAAVARRILDVVPEFIVFLPCKIALMEDGEGKLWVMTMDWDVSWLDYAQNPNSHLAKDIRVDAQKIRDSMRYIMEGAATGDF